MGDYRTHSIYFRTIALAVIFASQMASAFEYRPPDYHSCDADFAAVYFGDDGQCVVLGAYTKSSIGWDSQAGATPAFGFQGRGVFLASESAALVLGLRNQPEYRLGDYQPAQVVLQFDRGGTSETPEPVPLEAKVVNVWIPEAFVSLGSDVNVRAGLIDATFSSLAAKFDEPAAVELNPMAYSAPSLPGSSRAAVQTVLQVNPDASFGVALEGSGEGFEVIGRSDYSDGTSKGRATVTLTRAAKRGSASIDTIFSDAGGLLLTGKAFATDEGQWGLESSGRLQRGIYSIGTLVGLSDEGREAIVSIGLGDEQNGPSGAISMQAVTAQAYAISRMEAVGSVAALDGVRLSLALGRVEASLGPSSYSYARFKGELVLLGTVHASLIAEANSLGGQKGVLSIERSIP